MKTDDKQEIEKEIINEEEIAQRTKVIYWVHPHHRDNRPDKSQWTIIPDEEFECFVKAIITDKTFGLYLKDGKPQVLGKRKLKAIQEGKGEAVLYIARFVHDAACKVWHGYPADWELGDQDIPSSYYLKQWKAQGYFTPAQLRRIQKGKSL